LKQKEFPLDLTMLHKYLGDNQDKYSTSPLNDPVKDGVSVWRKRPVKDTPTSTLNPPVSNQMIASDITTEAEERMAELITAFADYNLTVKPHSTPFVYGPCVLRLQIKPKLGGTVTIQKYQSKATELKVKLALEIEPFIRSQPGFLSVDIPRRHPQPTMIADLVKASKVPHAANSFSFPLGVDVQGKTHWVDLADSNSTNILIGGTAGSGKSVLLQTILLGIGLTAKPRSVLFTLIDPKQVSFQQFRELPMLRSDDIITDSNAAYEALNELVQEMEDRYTIFAEEKIENISHYNELYPEQPLFRNVIILDEFSDLLSDKKTKLALIEAVKRIGQKGRAAGFHLILATQRPDKDVVSPLIKANLQMKIALKVTSEKNSRIILDESGAECLAGRGDMIIGGAVPIQRLQGPYFHKDDIIKLKSISK
ncbi:MAG: FtsK/SpoIIIE domain-containing protein, partial [Thermoguttaceae bacterium]